MNQVTSELFRVSLTFIRVVEFFCYKIFHMKESIGAWKSTCHVLMHTQRLIPLKLWHVSLSVYHNSVKKQRVTVCSHATVTFNTLDTAWNSFRGSGYWMFAGRTGIVEALRGVDVDAKTSCRSCTQTIRNIYRACFKCSEKLSHCWSSDLIRPETVIIWRWHLQPTGRGKSFASSE